MIELTLGEVAAIVHGRLAHADAATPVTGSVEFDSRKVTPGGLFLALPGERVDGHDYVPGAVEHGAAAGIVTHPVPAPSIEVADGFAALAALAGAVVPRLPDTTVIGVTGSAGKTSTKDLLAHLLGALGPTVAPPGSYNNELGHPYTVLRATPKTRFLVLETSARGIGHIAYLTRIAPPRIGVVLNVGSAHLGEFGSREAIAQAKGELVEALPSAADGGVAVLNADDPLVAAMAVRTQARVVLVGRAADAQVRASDVELDDQGRASFTLDAAGEAVPVTLPLVGEHHVANALAAAAVALECGATPQDIAGLLRTATPASRWRMETTERADGVVVINDAYNANPESMRAALAALARVGAGRAAGGARTWAVLGPMAELGADAPGEHHALGRHVAELGIAQLITVGDEARALADGAAAQDSWDGTATRVPDTAAAVELLRGGLRPGDVVLVKASRSASLERVADAITEDDRSDVQGNGGGAG
ncbi:UDP-N-acetylmuramoyl-tripeptide--D-alanyl-D-alanine ligase [uncultured Jatrophihabitans sp.]|uniref:UDP-N-acetylmuramoyl-tripeptide--D-alanyl-D- alanine ligase n=1 Tax=uncultured Jatrophihabitans sp. TaxID=1610747 RepID=UPI0035C97C42